MSVPRMAAEAQRKKAFDKKKKKFDGSARRLICVKFKEGEK